MEQIRIVKEMREYDRLHNRRTGWNVRPRYMVWENVPGAFSSGDPKGADFAAVIEEIIKVAEPDADVCVCVPKDGWTKSGCYYSSDGRWSIAWRVHDAQFWGVPQRRKRIALVADFGGLSAPDILFERKGLRGDFTQSGEERQSTSPDFEGGVGATSWTLKIRGGVEVDSAGKKAGKGALVQTERAGTIGVSQDQTLITIPMEGNGARPSHHGDGYGKEGDPMFSLNTTEQHAVSIHGDIAGTLDSNYYKGCGERQGTERDVVYQPMVYDNHATDARVTECGETAPTVAARYGTGGNNTPLVYEHRKQDARVKELGDVAPTVEAAFGAGGNNTPLVQECVSTYQDVTGSLCPGAHPGSYNGQDAYNDMLVTQDAVYQSVVRRLTPLECERLQGYPSEKKWDVSKMTKDEYIAWNLAEKNIIVDVATGKIFGTRGPGGIPYKEPVELKGTILNGYKVVSIRNGGTKLACRAHRVVWIAQNGIIPEGYVVDHINNDKLDNRIENLQLLTPAQNSSKAREDGLYKTGLDNHVTKIDPALKDEIAFLYEYSDMTYKDLAEIYGVTKGRIGQIIREVGYTDIGEWVDEKGKTRKTTDSARYKALGNSIALPFWFWLLRRISAQYERVATLGSLFDGLGGFPLVWERCNGKGTALWASEIEEFPIAVTKVRFPECTE